MKTVLRQIAVSIIRRIIAIHHALPSLEKFLADLLDIQVE